METLWYLGTKYSNGWDFKYLRFRKSSEGWLFINDDRHNKHGKDSAYPADDLDTEGVDWVEWYEENRPVKEEVLLEFQKYAQIEDVPNSYMIYNNGFSDLIDYPKVEQVRRETPKIQNNSLCNCGSGKKYKKCCK